MISSILNRIAQVPPFCVNPLNLVILTVISTGFLWVYVILPVNEEPNLELMLSLINDTDQSLCYINYVWTRENEHLRFKYILDDDELEKSNGKNVFFHLTNCIHDGVAILSARYLKFFIYIFSYSTKSEMAMRNCDIISEVFKLLQKFGKLIINVF